MQRATPDLLLNHGNTTIHAQLGDGQPWYVYTHLL